MLDSMLTTIDNPYNPFKNYDDWYAFDVQHGYFTCAYLARVAKTSDELSEADNDIAIEDAIDEIEDTGIEVVFGPENIRKGQRIVFADPDGNHIELSYPKID